MTSAAFEPRSHSTDQRSPFQSSPLPTRPCRSACSIHLKTRPQSRSSSSSFSLDDESKNDDEILCSSSLTRPKSVEYFQKSNSLDSGYKTLSAASHGTCHTDPIDEENLQREQENSFVQIVSSPSTCSLSSLAVVTTSNTNSGIRSKIEFVVGDEDDGDTTSRNEPGRSPSRSSRIDATFKDEPKRLSSGELRLRKNSLSNYSLSNYSVLLNEFCCTNDPNGAAAAMDDGGEKATTVAKKKSGFATTFSTFFSSKKKDDLTGDQQTPVKKIHRSRSVSETSLERTTINQEPMEQMKKLSIESADDQTDNEMDLNKAPTTTTYSIPSKTAKISTQSLLTTSNNQSQASSHSFGWLHRLSHRFTPSTSASRTSGLVKPSSTGLIFENRPNNLPPKSNEETLKHQVEYQKMCLEAKRAQQLFDEKEAKRQHFKLKREEFVSTSLKIWTHEILPYWDQHGGIHNCHDLTINAKAYKLWWHGLPPRIRGKVWKMAIGNELGLTHELFSQLEEMAREKLDATKQAEDARSTHSASPQLRTRTSSATDTLSTYIELIQLDVSRTFPQLGLFQQNGPYHEYLQLLLCIYVYLCPEVGYVQGQAFLAAMFLLNLDLFDSFVCFANLLHRPYFQTFYRFNNIDKYLQLFSQLLNYHLPKLSAHFFRMTIEPNCFALDWFFTIFSKAFPLDIVSRIWDMFFRDGDAFIFRTALAILSIYEERLCQLDTFHCLQFLTRLPDDLNPTALFKAIDKIRFEENSCELFYLIA